MEKSIVNKIFKSVKKSVILMSCLFFYTHYGDYIQGTKGSGTFAPLFMAEAVKNHYDNYWTKNKSIDALANDIERQIEDTLYG